MDSNHRNLAMADLQSAPFSHSGTYPLAVAAERHLQYLFEDLHIFRSEDNIQRTYCI